MDWRKSSLFICLLLCLCATSFAQTFDEEHWKETVDGLEYGELEAVEQPEPEVEEDFEIPSRSWSWPSLGVAGQTFVIVIFIALLVILIVKLIGNPGKKVGSVDISDLEYTLEQLEENIHESDLDRFLRLAIDEGEYRLALRVYYLMVIRRLSELNWIKWQKDKTNFDYVREMRQKEGHSSFRDLTLVFDIMWYGEAPVNEREYKILSPDFQRFIEQLNQEQNDEREDG